MKTIWFASSNQGKIDEINYLFRKFDIQVKSVLDLPKDFIMPDETGTTFFDNAMIKVKAVFDYVHEPVFADDSGLVVHALGGRPGVYSARFGGEHETGIEKVQRELTGQEDRSAHFHCSLILMDASFSQEFVGRVDGMIAETSSGTSGFGYDPIFIPSGKTQTYAEMNEKDKNEKSHRTIAFDKMMKSDLFHEIIEGK